MVLRSKLGLPIDMISFRAVENVLRSDNAVSESNSQYYISGLGETGKWTRKVPYFQVGYLSTILDMRMYVFSIQYERQRDRFGAVLNALLAAKRDKEALHRTHTTKRTQP